VTLEAVVSKRTTSKVTFKSSPDPKDNSKQLSQIPTPVDPTQCAYYTFTTPPSLDLKLAILGYCQNIFTPGGSFPINDGCVVCTDDEKRTVASQTSATQNNIPTDVVCRSSTTNPVRILRELTTGTTTSAIAVPTYQYYICGVPSVLCNSNTPKISLRNLRNLQSIDTGIRRILQKNVIEALSTPNQFEIALGIKNVSVVKVELIDGSFSPKIAFTTGASSNTMFGEYKTYINFSSEGQFDCYYKVQKQTTPSPTATDIKSCTNTNNCGKFVLKSPGMGISNIALPGFIVGTTYGVYAVCYNQSTSSVFASDVFIAYSFVPVCPDSFVLDANKNCVSTIMTTTKNDTVIAKGSFMREIGLFSTLFVILFALIFE